MGGLVDDILDLFLAAAAAGVKDGVDGLSSGLLIRSLSSIVISCSRYPVQ